MLNPGDYTGTYKVIAGELCLDFANTVSYRYTDHPHEWLDSYANLVAWGQMVGLLSERQAQALLNEARERPEEAKAVLNQAITLREAIEHIFAALKAGHSPQQDDLNTLNVFLADALHHLRMGRTTEGFTWEWVTDDKSLDPMLWPVAWSAVHLLMSDRIKTLGVCEECQWLYIDTSKNHSRRWCTMEDCGNRAKVRRHRKRKQEREHA